MDTRLAKIKKPGGKNRSFGMCIPDEDKCNLFTMARMEGISASDFVLRCIREKSVKLLSGTK